MKKLKNKRPQILENLLLAISVASGIPVAEIEGKGRQPEVVAARMAIWYIGRVYMNYPYKQLGRYFNRDHSTVMHGVEKVRKDQKMQDLLIEGLQKINPELLKKTKENRTSVSDWRF